MDPKTMWGSGNYAAVAERISDAGEIVIERSGAEPGMDVLDVACGTGNATIPAAREGGRVTGLDDSFDRVISTFGHMFAPDHLRTASEMRRVCRPGGRIAVPRSCSKASGRC